MDWQAAAVPRSSIRPDVNQAANVVIHFSTQVTFNHKPMVHNFPNPVQIRITQLMNLRVTCDVSLHRDAARQSMPDAINASQSNLYPLVVWYINV
jgi:hypothetical protein